MQLVDLITDVGAAGAMEISGLTADSRDVQPGFLFAAFQGTASDGADFIPQALEQGAVAVLASDREKTRQACGTTPGVFVRIPRQTFSKMAARFYGVQPETVVAITGTNGKTSVAWFAKEIWQRLGRNSASLGTLGVTSVAYQDKLVHTTPDPVTLHKALSRLAQSGVTHLAVEASSHGLDQYRLDGVDVTAAALTNITRDHMDYHSDFDAYAYSKLRLFGEVMGPRGLSVLCTGSELFAEAEALCWGRGHRIITVGDAADGKAAMLLEKRVPVGEGQELTIQFEGAKYEILLPLPGDFQAMNALTAAALVIGVGADAGKTFAALEALPGVPGRLDLVGSTPNGAQVYVDFAHTPDALQAALSAMRPHTAGRLSVVFGCGGDRDKGKRPQMGAIARDMADVVVVTDDNPRTENSAEIRTQILNGCAGASEIGDRAQAIAHAIGQLDGGDILVIAGKGHESGQIVGDNVIPFDDRQVAASVLAAADKGREA